MECKKCGKEITLNDGVVYCPYCGVKLKGQDAPKRRSIFTRELKVPGIVKAFIVWMLLCVVIWVLSVAFHGFDELRSDIYHIGLVLPIWTYPALIGAIALYITLVYVVYDHAKRHHRRAVAWTTAFIVFTPILAGLVYLLTWPKE